MRTRYRIAVLLATAAIVLAACSSGGGTAAPSAAAPSAAAPSAGAASEAPASAAAGGEPVTVDWWHITTDDPGKADFQAAADAYMAAHPNVTIKITVLENEAFKTKLSTTAAGRLPGPLPVVGRRRSWPQQADAGLLKDITADIADWKDTINPGAMSIYAYNGKQYGVPWDMGMIGFWYNKDAVRRRPAITAPPATWDEYLAAVEKLKAAGIDPLAIAGKDKWPSMHLWTYLVLRNGGGDALIRDDPERQLEHRRLHQGRRGCSGAQRARAVPGRLQVGRLQRRGRVGRQRQGRHGADGPVGASGRRWTRAPTRRASATTSAGSRSRRSTAAPAQPTDGVGGGNGIAVGMNAPPEAIDFLKFFSSVDNGNKLNTDNVGLSPVVGTEGSVTDPNLQAVLAGRGNATFMQLYLDQATSGGLGQAFNDATIALFLGQSTPAEVCQALTDAAASRVGPSPSDLPLRLTWRAGRRRRPARIPPR